MNVAQKGERIRTGPSFDQVAEELRLDELERCLSGDENEQETAFTDAESRFASDKAGLERLSAKCARPYALFKLFVEEKEGWLRWQALKEQTPDKSWDTDAEVLKLWKTLDSDSSSKELASCHWSVVYHRLWLFEWFLRRYDIRRARSVAGGEGFWAQNVHFLLLGVVAVAFALRRFELLGSHETFYSLAFCGLAYAAVLTVLALSFKVRKKLPDGLEALTVATHSLIPRLAGAGAVGLIILASSQDLLKVVVGTKPWWLIGLLLAGYGYLLLEMTRRVHPLPRLRRLTLHALDIAVTALTHSMALALLAEGALRKVLDGAGGNYGWSAAASVVVFVFSIGLVVNLIWADQPVTEPL